MKLVDFETAKDLYKLGYDYEHRCCYTSCNDKPVVIECDELNNVETCPEAFVYPAPTLQEAAEWLRTRYGVNVRVEPYCDGAQLDRFTYSIDIYDPNYGWRVNNIIPVYASSYDRIFQSGINSALNEIIIHEMRKLNDR